MSYKQFSILFAFIAVAELSAETLSVPSLIYLTKPLIMLSLISFYISKVNWQTSRFHKYMIAGFIWSLTGDILLMFTDVSPNFFLTGLCAFLIAHLLYIAAFSYNIKKSPNPALLKSKPIAALPFLLFYAILSYFLLPNLEQMLAPVMVYASVITGMVLMALNRYKAAPPESVTLVFTGALLFMASDTLIAIDRFIRQIDGARALIMSSYIVAQYFIALGAMRFHPHRLPGNV